MKIASRSAAAVCAAALVAWPAAARTQGPVKSLLELRAQSVVVQQWDTSCGAAALATVLTYTFNDPVAERQAAQAMLKQTDPLRVRVRGGFSLLDMKRFAESRGYEAAGYRGLELDQLLRMQSPIVPIDERGDPHFVVVRGARDGELDIADPAFGNRRMPIERFLKVWKDGIGFAITRPKS